VTSGDNKSLVDQALDAFVYAPLGLLLEARDLIPKMADRGRGQVALARLAGRVAQNQRRSAGHRDPETGTPQPNTAPDNGATSASTDDEGLPIEGYDDLSAPQIIPMLESLSADELSTILAHEADHRSRATVVNRIRQLLAPM